MDSTKPLNLKIEWKGVLKKGQELSPNFVITGENLHALKSVTCKLDERIESPYWKKNPQEPQDIVGGIVSAYRSEGAYLPGLCGRSQGLL